MTRLVLANAFSFTGALFLCLSCLAKTKKRVATCQLIQCAFLTCAQIAFGKPSGAISMSAAFARNLLIALGRYSTPSMVAIASFTLIFGISLNVAGIIGLLPVGAGSFYTIATRFAKGVVGMKLALMVLLSVWIIYSVLIFDVFGALSNLLALTLNVITLTKIIRKKKQSPM